MKKAIRIFKYLIFLAIGLALFWYKYQDFDFNRFLQILKTIKWEWIYVSFIFAILSHLSRALRWNMLINPIGYSPKWYNTFFSVMVMYATNLIIPRGGEIARCTVLAKNEDIPLGKLLGTVVAERATDTIILILLVITTLFFQIDVFRTFMKNNPESMEKISFIFSIWFWIALTVTVSLIIYVLWRNRDKIMELKLLKKIKTLIFNLIEGIKSIKKVKNPILFIAHSLFIYIMYFLMMYVVFFSYTPTQNTSVIAGLTTFIMGGLAMLAPVQGGIGAWHFMVIESLKLYNLEEIFAENFAFLAHTSMNLFLLIAGGICFIMLPIFRKKTVAK